MSTIPILERLKTLLTTLDLPLYVGAYLDTPPPRVYVVATPLTDLLEVWADGTPGAEVEEVRLSLFASSNYLALRDRLTRHLVDEGFTITARRYVGYEVDTGFHHYAIDVADYRPFGA